MFSESNFESESGLSDAVGVETSWKATGSPAPSPLLSSPTDSKLDTPALLHTSCPGPSPTCGLTLTSWPLDQSCVGQSALPEEAGLNIAA